MRTLFLALALGHAGSLYAEEASFKRGDVEFKLKAVAKTIASPYTNETMQVEYSIYRDGKFVHRAAPDGGRVTGCTYGSATSLPKQTVYPLAWKGTTYGWMIKVLGVCGNTSSKKVQLIVLSDKEKDRYFTKTFVTKDDPILRDEGPDLGVWYVYQEWGDAGTAGSFFVPMSFKVALGTYSPFAPVPYPNDVATWPAYKNFPYTLASYVAAGIEALDPGPVRAAAARLTPKDAEHLGYVGLPKTPEGLAALAAGIEQSSTYIRKFRRTY